MTGRFVSFLTETLVNLSPVLTGYGRRSRVQKVGSGTESRDVHDSGVPQNLPAAVYDQR